MEVVGDADGVLDAVTAAQEALGSPVVHGSDVEGEIEDIWMQLDRISADLMDDDEA